MRGLDHKKLGVYWGSTGLYFVETALTTPRRMFFVPFPRQGQGAFKPSRILPESVSFVSSIQQAFQQNEVALGSVNLSLPANDIIFRTFVVPWMKVAEIKGVVGFEAMKYIPFELNELYYAYYPQTITEGNVKKIRVIFVAIKRDVLESYRTFLEQIGLKIDVVEPSPLSLVRVLMFKKILTDNQSFAVLEHSLDSGKIIVVDQGVPQFVREFQLFAPGGIQKSDKGSELNNSRLVNEARISLDYFGRQDNQLRISKLILISTFNNQELAKSLEDSLSIKVVSMDSQDIVGTSASGHVEFIHSYGIGLIDELKSLANFNLSPEETKAQLRATSAANFASQVDFKKVGMVGALCAAIIGGAFALLGPKTVEPKNRLDTVNVSLGEFKDAEVEKLNQKLSDLNLKFNKIQNVRLAGESSKILEVVPQLLPSGAWLKNLEIAYLDTDNSADSNRYNKKPVKGAEQEKIVELKLNISGYIYSENTKEQFALVDKYLGSLRGNELFKKAFKLVELDTVKLEPMQGFTVTYFEIICQ